MSSSTAATASRMLKLSIPNHERFALDDGRTAIQELRGAFQWYFLYLQACDLHEGNSTLFSGIHHLCVEFLQNIWEDFSIPKCRFEEFELSPPVEGQCIVIDYFPDPSLFSVDSEKKEAVATLLMSASLRLFIQPVLALKRVDSQLTMKVLTNFLSFARGIDLSFGTRIFSQLAAVAHL